MAKEQAELIIKIKETGSAAFNKISDGIKSIAGFAASAGVAIAGFAALGIKAFKEQELATNQLNQSLAQQGIFTKELSNRYQELASSLQQSTTFGDEAIISSQAQLQAYLGQTEITEDLLKATLDFAAAQKVDLKTAADLVGKTVGSTTNALGRYGIEIEAGASKAEKLAAVTDKLNQKFGGQAAAAASGLGAIDQLKNTFGDVFEVVGGLLAPTIVKFAKELSTFFLELQKNTAFIDGMTAAIGFLAKAAVLVKDVIVGVAEAIGTSLGSSVLAISELIQGNFKKAGQAIADGFRVGIDDARNRARSFADELKSIDDLIVNQRAQTNAQLEQLEVTSAENRKSIAELEAEEKMLRDEEQAAIALENETERQLKLEELRLAAELRLGEISQKAADDRIKRLDAENKKQKLLEDKRANEEQLRELELAKFRAFINSQRVQDTQSVLGQIATLSSANNKTLAAIGKAAAIANITISTAQGVAKAFSLGPILGPILAPIVIAAGAAQAATVAGVQLADGGIVRATPGGVQATIGEGGQDEAVIPLENGAASLGTTINLTVNGGLMGNSSDAREFAIAIDRELLKLRQDNGSVAFDRGIV